ncbi:MAG: pyruvate formate lyase family protein [Planctomycetota bacterium]|jgi:formate C-acetyltransferase
MSDTASAQQVDPDHAEFISRLGDWFVAMLDETPIEFEEGDSCNLVSPIRLNHDAANKLVPDTWGADGYHQSLGTKQLMELGLAGIAEMAERNAEKVKGFNHHYLLGIARVYRRACQYCRDWADAAAEAADAAVDEGRLRLKRIESVCRSLAEGPPQSLHEAVQLAWFGMTMRNACLTSPPGRLDQYLYPFYQADLERGDITPEFAQLLIDELFVKLDQVWTGDGLMNLVIGGVDAEGNDATNEMSFMMAETATRLVLACPQMNVRVHSGTPESFRQKLTALQLAPTGGCSVLNDEVLIPAFVAEGIPVDLARNYCCDGCNELLFDGESLIHFTMVEAVKSLEVMLFNGQEIPLPEGFVPRANYHYAVDEAPEVGTGLELGYETGDFATMTSFEQAFDAYLDQYLYQLRRVMEGFTKGVRDSRTERVTDPFLAGTFRECLETGKDPQDGGVRWQSMMIFAGSLPTVADGLAAIKKVVFDDKACAPAELLDALRDDWEGHEALRKQFQAAPKFGNDDEYVDEIAAELVRRFDAEVRGFEHDLGYPVFPALFCHTFNLISMTVNATPDGRKRGDAVAEHFSPVPGRALSGPTAVINSMKRAPLDRMCGTAVTHVSLSRTALGTPAEAAVVVRNLLDTALGMGLIVVNFPIYDVEQMIDAQKNPDQHADLMVRVWGFSDRFITLDKRLQDHLIARAVNT